VTEKPHPHVIEAETSLMLSVMISFDLDHAFDRVSHHFLLDLSKVNNNIAFRLLRVSKPQRDREHVRTRKMDLHRKKRTLTINQILSRNFSLNELETALMSPKPGKAAGFDGIYPEFQCTY
jgi:hypothetical protein